MSYTSFDFPHTHFYDDDLRELIRIVVETRKVLHDFVSLNTIKYADPIQWNITTQYPGNTVVIDPVTGTAYLSTRPVPSGVPLSNTNYWTEIFNLGQIISNINKNLTVHNDGSSATSTFDLSPGDWVLWNNVLYKAKHQIYIGDAYVVDANIERKTVEDFFNELVDELETEIETRANEDERIELELTDLINSRVNVEAQTRASEDERIELELTDLINSRVNVEAQTRANEDDAIRQEIINTLKHTPFEDETRYFKYFTVLDEDENVHKALADFNVNAIAPINVLDYGIVNDGVTDNTTALTSLLNNASVLYFPSGEYLFNSDVVIPSSRILKTDDAVIKLNNNATIYIHSYITFDGFKIECMNNNVAITLDTLAGNVLNTNIVNITIDNPSIGIKDNGGQGGAGNGHIGYNVKFKDININSPTGTGGFVCTNMFGFILLERCVIDFTQMSSPQQYYGFYFIGVEGITFVRCDVLGRGINPIDNANTSTAFYLKGSAIWLNKCMVDTVSGFGFNISNSTYVYITDCIASIMGNSGFYLDNCNEVQFERIYIYGTRGLSIASIGYSSAIIMSRVNNAILNNINIANMIENGLLLTSCEHINASNMRIKNSDRGIIETNNNSLCMYTNSIISCLTKQIVTIGAYDIVANLLYESGLATQYNVGAIDI